jgi:hypothetical protein
VVCIDAELAADPCGFFVAASPDETENTKAMARNGINFIFFSQ